MFRKIVSEAFGHLKRATTSNRQRRRANHATLQLCELEPRVLLDSNSIGTQGIFATDLKSHDGVTTLDGKDVRIGMVEPERVGKKDFDAANRVHDDVDPAKVYLVDSNARPNRNIITGHALAVAGVMIATGVEKGVSPAAKLYSSAVGNAVANSTEMFEDYILASQQEAITDEVRAINHSYGFIFADAPGAGRGTSLLSLGLDWVAIRKDVLNVIARGNHDQFRRMGIPEANFRLVVPADSYNGIVVGGAATDAGQGNKYAKVYAPNTVIAQSLDGRWLTHILAPSEHITVPVLDDRYENRRNAPDAGSSIAAPHVTSTVALLQQYANIRKAVPAEQAKGWNADSIKHQVMKAVILNSAEKLNGELGMTRNVIKSDGISTWLNSDAVDEEAGNAADTLNRKRLPIDNEMGFGFLNASRAVKQFGEGRYTPADTPTGPIGWDFRQIGNAVGDTRRYKLPKLKADTYISITLTWDRTVTLDESRSTARDNKYTVAARESFTPTDLANLDLYLVKRADNGDITKAVWSSISGDGGSASYNLEHIFFKITDETEYDIIVRRANDKDTNVQYGLAWWSEKAEDMLPPCMKDINGTVWHDIVLDVGEGLREYPSEAGIPALYVELYKQQPDASYALYAITSTDSQGHYSFRVPHGSYFIQITPAFGMNFTLANVGFDDTIDSDFDGYDNDLNGIDEYGRSYFTFSCGISAITLDAGLVNVLLGSVGDRVWNDLNGNGIQDPGEPGFSGVEVRLYTSDGDWFATTNTDSTGTYLFTDVLPDSYHIEVGRPANFAFSPQDQTNDAADSDVDFYGVSDIFTVQLNQHITSVDVGLMASGGSLSGWVWFDVNVDGLQDFTELGIPDLVVSLYTESGVLVAQSLTDSFGMYTFSDLPPRFGEVNDVAQGYYVEFELPDSAYAFGPPDVGSDDTIDSDVTSTGPDPLLGRTDVRSLLVGQSLSSIDAGLYQPASAVVSGWVWSDLNGDGLYDSVEPALTGVTVSLFKIVNSVPILIGSQQIDPGGRYLFTGLEPGWYEVQFDPTGSEYVFTLQNIGADDSVDSDANAAGLTNQFFLGSGTIAPYVDAGLLTGSGGSGGGIGDYVWVDLDADGIQDGGEPGMGGVTVNLLDELGGWLNSTTTDSTGYYHFTGLAAGNYKLQFIAPYGYSLTLQDQGADDTLDSDADASGLTVVYSLAANQQRTDVDAGPIYTGSGGSGGSGGSIGDYVWDDLDGDGVQDTGEWGLWGVTVNLLDEFGGWLASTTTDSFGYYQFIGLAAGNYKLQFVAPSGYSFTLQGQGTDDTLDSDADAAGLTAILSLAFNENRTNVDAGLIYTGSGGSGGSGGSLAPLSTTGDSGSPEASGDSLLDAQDAGDGDSSGDLGLADLDALFALLADEEDSDAELLQVL